MELRMTADNSGTPRQPRRSDARHNRERLLTAAREVFTEHGTSASLNEIVRRAGVGPGTLYRHFPTREALLEASFGDQVEALCAQAYDLVGSSSMPPAEALATWLRAVVQHATRNQGLAASMVTALRAGTSAGTATPAFTSAHDSIRAAGTALLTRAQQSGVARPDLDASDLLRLANAVAWAADQDPRDPATADRLMSLVTDGWRLPQPPAA
jgi:AcrR family transcriptional regulator